MLIRSKRSDIHSTATSSDVGPGTYELGGNLLHPLNHAVAPFGSTSTRTTLNTQSEDIPGPGSYFSMHSGTQNAGPRKPTSQFASRLQRIPLNRSEIESRSAPGPGSYTGDLVRPRNPKSPPFLRPISGKSFHAAEGINWVKVATAPSIPSVAQSYGYEEGPNGALVQQNNPVRGHAGVGRDTLGPGEYDPDDLPVRPRRHAPNFGAVSKRSDPLKHTAAIPGPGSYEVATVGTGPTFHGGIFAERQTSAFASKIKRSHVPQSASPGPGAYRVPSTFVPLREYLAAHPEAYQAFGRTKSDSNIVHTGAEKESVPGPGQYDPPVEITAFSSTKKKGLSTIESMAPRFTGMDANAKEAPPGPGSYETTVTTLASKLTHQVKGRFGAFGSTSSRFADSSNNSGAGPGAYNVPAVLPNPAEARRKDARSSVFRSASRRADLGYASAAPGKFYDPPTEWHKPTTQSRAFISNQPRFANGENDACPAPGQYNPKLLVSTTSAVPKFGSAPRFVPSKTDPTPGPGTYSTVPGMIRRTFNISIGA